jgi:hypothetical protein
MKHNITSNQSAFNAQRFLTLTDIADGVEYLEMQYFSGLFDLNQMVELRYTKKNLVFALFVLNTKDFKEYFKIFVDKTYEAAEDIVASLLFIFTSLMDITLFEVNLYTVLKQYYYILELNDDILEKYPEYYKPLYTHAAFFTKYFNVYVHPLRAINKKNYILQHSMFFVPTRDYIKNNAVAVGDAYIIFGSEKKFEDVYENILTMLSYYRLECYKNIVLYCDRLKAHINSRANMNFDYNIVYTDDVSMFSVDIVATKQLVYDDRVECVFELSELYNIFFTDYIKCDRVTSSIQNDIDMLASSNKPIKNIKLKSNGN